LVFIVRIKSQTDLLVDVGMWTSLSKSPLDFPYWINTVTAVTRCGAANVSCELQKIKVNTAFDIDTYLLTAIGLTPGGSSTVHSYTQTVKRTTQWNRIHRIEYT